MTFSALLPNGSTRTPRRRTALALSLLVAWTTLASTTTVPADATAAPAPAAAAASSGSVDAMDRDSVIRGFNNTWLPTLGVPFSWTGSVESCVPGAPSGEYRAAVLTQINYVRDQAGVSPVSLGDNPNTAAQAAALLMDANDNVSHNPPTSWRCWTQNGATGAATSQLSVNGDHGLARLISDAGPTNVSTGHRTALLDEAIQVMGVGVAPGATAINTAGFGNGEDDGRNWPMLTWPTAGYFPEGVLPESGRWSVTARDARSLANATVTVERVGGGMLSAPVEFRSDTHIVFTPAGVVRPAQVDDDVSYRVRISGVQNYSGNPVADIIYTTTLVSSTGIGATWTTSPSIPGTPAAGRSVTVNPGSYTPVHSGDQVSYTWFSRGEAIGTGPTITPTMAHYGAPLSVEVKVRRVNGKTATATVVHSSGDVTYSGPPQVINAPVLTGDAAFGATLSVTTGLWDRPPAYYEYRWFRESNMIPGATAPTYTTSHEDAGANITARVTAYSPEGEATYASSNSVLMPTIPPPAKPQVVAAPFVGGAAVAGSTLTAMTGQWWGAEHFTFQWYRGGSSIAGATSQNYTATNADIGNILNITVTAHGPGGSATAWGTGSAMVRPPTAPPPPPNTGSDIMVNGNPVIKGKGKVGKKLKVALPTYTPSSVSLKIQWKRNGKTIKGATKTTYKVTKKDKKKKITVVVSASKSGYATKTLTSMPVKIKK